MNIENVTQILIQSCGGKDWSTACKNMYLKISYFWFDWLLESSASDLIDCLIVWIFSASDLIDCLDICCFRFDGSPTLMQKHSQ